MSNTADELATLITDVRHEANNALMAIFGYLDLLLLSRDDLPENVTLKLTHISTEAKRLRDCIARTDWVRRPGE
jgi:signal transduction histidine kinase